MRLTVKSKANTAILFAILTATASLAQAGLIAHWAFDEATSATGTGVANDSSENRCNGTVHGSAAYAAGFSAYMGPNTSQPDTFPPAAAPCDPTGNNPPCLLTDSVPEMSFFSRSRHPGGVNIALCDGSARFVGDAINVTTWRALSTTHGGEVTADDY